MIDTEIKIKLSYITGLKRVVLNELEAYYDFHILSQGEDSVYLEFSENLIQKISSLKSVARAYVVLHSEKYNPKYISNHKSVLDNLLRIVLDNNKEDFKSFKISCAGSASPEVNNLVRYLEDKYSLSEKEEADLKIHIIKLENTWEIGVQITPRPLSLREYKAKNMSGAMDPTIAYAMNSFCNLDRAKTYLNIFSGSATLLIEAGQCYPNLNKLVGFDNNKKRLSLAIQNIKKARLIKEVQILEKNIFDKPDFGKFDAITADLPFGMSISKNEDLNNLYRSFIEYCQEVLNPDGRLVAYTSEYEILEKILNDSKFEIVKTLNLKFITSVDAYLRPRIFVCELK